ncbi:MAG: DEAD/DEAH box helicase family protein [Candidatus Coatesbacteria bacterium]|nr:DEAD/DEAH box helicase family protein [Candidatus Coatesbacteria bacterium]
MFFEDGSLVKFRNRQWVKIPSNNNDLVLLQPLNGTEEETVGIYKQLGMQLDNLEPYTFPLPDKSDIGEKSLTMLLFDAIRLSIRSSSSTFRSIARLSFRPRAYQIVPLVMALRQKENIRLFIADDVGVGKTIETILVLKELIERGEIKKFAVLCLPHLCDQWQKEMQEKMGIDPVIIRTNTQGRLDREMHGDRSIYDYYPYQIISIDFIKFEKRRNEFIINAPEMVVIDEAHSCSRPSGTNNSQKLRYSIVEELAKNSDKGLILLTATPHSGKIDEFQSLLGLISNDFLEMDITTADAEQRRQIAKYYVQRRRNDLEKWFNEETPFPNRIPNVFYYSFSDNFLAYYEKIHTFALKLMKKDNTLKAIQQKFRYWSALVLLRGITSSPASGIEMLKNRIKREEDKGLEEIEDDIPYIEKDFTPDDNIRTDIIDRTEFNSYEKGKLSEFASELESFKGLENDSKLAKLNEILKSLLKEGFNTIVYCRFINTAKYIEEFLKGELEKIHKSIIVQAVTSEDDDETRKIRIDDMLLYEKRILIATDCLSEGINLQDKFNAVIHYDLPWNPNKLEQREGRIDRFGQKCKEVKVYYILGENNRIDKVIWDILLEKIKNIRKNTGISVPFPEDNATLMDLLFEGILKKEAVDRHIDQGEIFEDIRYVELARKAEEEIDNARKREEESREIFAQNAIKANEIEEDLLALDDTIGSPEAVEKFVINAVQAIRGINLKGAGKGYYVNAQDLDEILSHELFKSKKKDTLKISFKSPVDEGFTYIGRNHPFVEQLSKMVIAQAFSKEVRDDYIRRVSVIKSSEVNKITSIFILRLRHVIEEKKRGRKIYAEEVILFGYSGLSDAVEITDREELEKILSMPPSANMEKEEKVYWFEEIMRFYNTGLQERLKLLSETRLDNFIESHERYKKIIDKGSSYRKLNPLSPDLLGLYILVPDKGVM